jgi:putative pyrimidine permease RutG
VSAHWQGDERRSLQGAFVLESCQEPVYDAGFAEPGKFMGMLDWTEKSADVLQQGGVIGPDERLPWPQTAVMGVQHVIAMFGATVLAPILMGFDPNIAILMSGIGTLIFFGVTGGKVPSYLGSSFAFIGVVIAASAYAGKGPNANIGVALGGIIACGACTP